MNELISLEVPPIVFLAIDGVLFLLLVWVLLYMRANRKKLDSVGAYRPVVPTDRLIAYWKRQMAKYEPGTPKYKAYRKRLSESGD